MREVLGTIVLIAVVILVFAYSGDAEAVEAVEGLWQAILDAVRELGEAWRGK